VRSPQQIVLAMDEREEHGKRVTARSLTPAVAGVHASAAALVGIVRSSDEVSRDDGCCSPT
jgi:hypothetical protein